MATRTLPKSHKTTKKQDQQAIDRERNHQLDVEELAKSLVFILTNPVTPERLHKRDHGRAL
jgi:hypothetical protein